MNGIDAYKCVDLRVDRVRLRDCSTGVYAEQCNNVWCSNLEGYNFRGPFPRGQLAQYNKCQNGLLEDFSVINQGSIAWTEDNINMYGCTDPHIRRGFISGNNSPSGVGVLIENSAGGSGGLIEDVDVVYWSNGAFSAATDADHVVFRGCRARDGLDVSSNASEGKPDYQGKTIPNLKAWEGGIYRGAPSSGSEAFLAYQATRTIEYHTSKYYTLPAGVCWDRSLMTVAEFSQENFMPRAPIKLVFAWE